MEMNFLLHLRSTLVCRPHCKRLGHGYKSQCLPSFMTRQTIFPDVFFTFLLMSSTLQTRKVKQAERFLRKLQAFYIPNQLSFIKLQKKKNHQFPLKKWSKALWKSVISFYNSRCWRTKNEKGKTTQREVMDEKLFVNNPLIKGRKSIVERGEERGRGLSWNVNLRAMINYESNWNSTPSSISFIEFSFIFTLVAFIFFFSLFLSFL